MSKQLEEMSVDELKMELERLEKEDLMRKLQAHQEAKELEEQQQLREQIKAELMEDMKLPESKVVKEPVQMQTKPEWMEFKEDFSQRNNFSGLSYEDLCKKVFKGQL